MQAAIADSHAPILISIRALLQAIIQLNIHSREHAKARGPVPA